MSPPVDPEVILKKKKILSEIEREELKFVTTLERGEKLLEELLSQAIKGGNLGGNGGENPPFLSGKDVFTLYDTFGFPVEITEEVALENGVKVDFEGFEREMEAQRKRAQVRTLKILFISLFSSCFSPFGPPFSPHLLSKKSSFSRI